MDAMNDAWRTEETAKPVNTAKAARPREAQAETAVAIACTRRANLRTSHPPAWNHRWNGIISPAAMLGTPVHFPLEASRAPHERGPRQPSPGGGERLSTTPHPPTAVIKDRPRPRPPTRPATEPKRVLYLAKEDPGDLLQAAVERAEGEVLSVLLRRHQEGPRLGGQHDGPGGQVHHLSSLRKRGANTHKRARGYIEERRSFHYPTGG